MFSHLQNCLYFAEFYQNMRGILICVFLGMVFGKFVVASGKNSLFEQFIDVSYFVNFMKFLFIFRLKILELSRLLV